MPDSGTSYGHNYGDSETESTTESVRRLLSVQGPTNAFTQCFIHRTKGGVLSGSGKRRYDLCSKDSSTVLATVQAQGGTTETSYVITHLTDLVGKLKWDSHEFQLVDSGANMRKLTWEQRELFDRGELHARTELCTVSHSTNSASKTRFIRAVLRSGRERITLLTKSPTWDPDAKHSKLDFKGRVTMPSVKNFQLIVEGEPTQKVVMQFGKVGKDAFNMDYAAPLTALQAFGIVLSVFRAGSY